MNLAAYALKFSTFGFMVFCVTFFQRTDILALTATLGLLAGTVSASSTADFKKMTANLSVVHMSFSLLLLAAASQTAVALSAIC